MTDPTPFISKYCVVYCLDDHDFEGYIAQVLENDVVLDCQESYILIPLERITHIEMPKWTGSTFKKVQQGLPLI